MDNESQTLLTPSTILAECENCLMTGGYRVARDLPDVPLPKRYYLFAEDPFGIVGLVVYEMLRDLLISWPEAQSAIAELLTRTLGQTDPKRWEGYLVLITSAPAGPEHRAELDKIRYDTSRLRKLVITGDELTVVSDIKRALMRLLPLDIEQQHIEIGSMLDYLPGLLAKRGIDEEAVHVLIDAFIEQQPLVPRLHEYLEEKK